MFKVEEKARFNISQGDQDGQDVFILSQVRLRERYLGTAYRMLPTSDRQKQFPADFTFFLQLN